MDEWIVRVAPLYERFAYSLDLDDRKQDQAMRIFDLEMATRYDALPVPKVTFQEFRRGVVVRCKMYLKERLIS